jgi:hypothetical protein
MNEEERYKLEKELWVSNLTGSTLEEIIFVLLIIPVLELSCAGLHYYY